MGSVGAVVGAVVVSGAVVETGGSEVPGVVSGMSGKQAESREDMIKTAKIRQKSRFIGIYLREITACIISYGREKRKCFCRSRLLFVEGVL